VKILHNWQFAEELSSSPLTGIAILTGIFSNFANLYTVSEEWMIQIPISLLVGISGMKNKFFELKISRHHQQQQIIR
jgi:hypothetical protein